MRQKGILTCAGNADKTVGNAGTEDTWEDDIRSMVAVVRLETEEHHKPSVHDDSELTALIQKRIGEHRHDFSSNGERRRYFGKIVREVVWEHANRAEADIIIERLKAGDRLFTQQFFYGTSRHECNISRLRSRTAAYIRQQYQVDISVEEFGNIVYAHLWDNGTWSPLDSYAGKSSFFSWLEKVARHEVMKVLEEMKIISVHRERTAGNTRLLGVSVPDEAWRLIITELMPPGLSHDLLLASFVEHKDETAMAKEHAMDTESLREAMAKAKACLKDRLISHGGYFEELVLRDKNGQNIEVPASAARDLARQQEDRSDTSPLADMLGVNLEPGELEDKVIEFLYGFSEQLPWSEEDRILWQMRFIEGTSPVEIAERFGRPRSWIDNRYSRLNKRFNTAIRTWWERNSE